MANYGKKTVKDLQALCRQRGLDFKSKKKADLIDRLVTADGDDVDDFNSDHD